MWRRFVIGLALLALPAGLLAQGLGRLAEQEKARREKANEAVRGEYVHTIPQPKQPGKSRGYRPERKTAKRRDRR